MNNPIKILRDYRFANHDRRITQEHLAEELNVNQAKISRMERADLDKLDFQYLQKLAKFFEFDSIEEMIQWRPKELKKYGFAEQSTHAKEDHEPYITQNKTNKDCIQIMITLDGSESAHAKAIELLNLNHKYLKSG